MVTVSIITICYNEKETIARTAESVMAQDCSDFEWIVIDGGSRDGTKDILNVYRNRIAYFVSEADNGIYNAMNKGIIQAKGDYLLFLNGGDAFVSSDIVTIIQPILKQKLYDIVYGEICLQDGTRYKSLRNNVPITLGFFLRPQSLNHQATFIKRSLFHEHGLYNESFRYAGDYEWFLRVFLKTGAACWQYVDRIVAIFDRNGVSENRALRSVILKEVLRAQALNKVPLHRRFVAQAKIALYRTIHSSLRFFKHV